VGQAVAALASRYGLPFELGELHLGPDATETAARRARYAWLADVQRRRAARYLVTAHHRDDQVETILLRRLRGSAPAGLAGMPARARGGLVRPLLAFTHLDLVEHVTARGLPVHHDPANRDPRHLRSWVRTVLLPLVSARLGEGARADLARAGRAAALERRAWDRVLRHLPDLDLQMHEDGFDVARGRVGGSAFAPGGCAGTARWYRASAHTAVVDGRARVTQRPGAVPDHRARRNHSLGSRNLPECCRSPAARNPGGASGCYQARRVSSRPAGVSSSGLSSTKRQSRAASASWARRSRQLIPTASSS